MRHRFLLGTVLDPVGHESPPPALFAEAPAGELALDDGVHLQTFRVILALAVGFARKQGDEVDEYDARWMNPAEDGAKRLSAMPDLLHRHCSIICSNGG